MATLGELYSTHKNRLSHLVWQSETELRWMIESVWEECNSSPFPSRFQWEEVEVAPLFTKKLDQLLHQREWGEPLAYILGTVEFYGREFKIVPGVLIPRPESELFITALRDLFQGKGINSGFIWEIGTGSGALLATVKAEFPDFEVGGNDVSPTAVDLAKRNWELMELDLPCPIIEWDGIPDWEEVPSIVLCNPPYIPHLDQKRLPRQVMEYEPALALFGGEKGIEFTESLFTNLATQLHKDSYLIIEIGQGQTPDLEKVGEQKNFKMEKTYQDFSGIERILVFRKRN